MKIIGLRALLAATSLALCATLANAAETPFKLRASLDTAVSHGRNVAAADYLKKVEQASGGRIQTELFSSGALFKDRDVGKALRQGNIEMAIPGTWVLSGFVPDADVIQLPAFYGQPIDLQHKFTDGKGGAAINAQLEEKLAVKVLGPWLDLGFNNTYSTSKPLNDVSDLDGLKLRTSGGAGQFARAKFFGAVPNMTAWPDVPLSLSQGNFDALSSTNESLVSAKLWDSGVKFAFEDHQFLGLYVPLFAKSFYDKLPPDLQKVVVDTWTQNIPAYRKNMADAQTRARKELEEHGIKFVDPSPEKIAAVRTKMLAVQDEIAKELKITPALVKEATAELQSGS